jgi:hypothetical protein
MHTFNNLSINKNHNLLPRHRFPPSSKASHQQTGGLYILSTSVESFLISLALRHERLNLHAALSLPQPQAESDKCVLPHSFQEPRRGNTRAPDDLLKERKSSQGAQFAP